jgi:hypothetical protein
MPLFVGLWQVCVGDGTFMRYFLTHDPFWRFPTWKLMVAVLEFRVYEGEAAPPGALSSCATKHVPVSDSIASATVIGCC